jgi:hypothetical protein
MSPMEFEQAKLYIKEQTTRTELLAQLAEEAAELGHAALKMRRVIEGTNPTPVSHSLAFENLVEEVADVRLLMYLLDFDLIPYEIERRMGEKLTRWCDRLKERMIEKEEEWSP